MSKLFTFVLLALALFALTVSAGSLEHASGTLLKPKIVDYASKDRFYYPVLNVTRGVKDAWFPFSTLINGTGLGCIQVNWDLYTVPASSTSTIREMRFHLDAVANHFLYQPMQFTYVLYVRPSGFNTPGQINSACYGSTIGLPVFPQQYQVIEADTDLISSSMQSVGFSFNSYEKPNWTPIPLGPGDSISLALLGGPSFVTDRDYSYYGYNTISLGFP